MALPPGITPKTVTVGIASFFDGTLAEGTATITAPFNVVHTPSNRPIFSSQISKRFVDGEASFNLAPTDAPGLNRVDWTYKLNVVIQGALVQPDPIYFTLPAAGPDVIDLDALVPVPSSAGIPVSVAVLTAEDLDGYAAQYIGDTDSATRAALEALDLAGDPITPQAVEANLPARLSEVELRAASASVARGVLDDTGLAAQMSVLDPEVLVADRAPAPLTIPTYDGTGESAHPSVFYAANGWGADSNGKAWKWWMAHTPLAGSLSDVENPSIVVSDDGRTWVNPPGLTNPITPKPSGGYNSDTELVLGPDGLLYCFYRPVLNATEHIAYKTSTNGIAWSTENIALTSTGLTTAVLSPSIAYDFKAGLWRMWTVNGSVDPNRVEMRAAATLGGPWSAPVPCTLTVPLGTNGTTQEPWHLGVTRIGSQWVMLLNSTTPGGSGQNGYNWLAVSADGVTWTIGSKPVTPRGSGGGNSRWDNNPYRGVIVPVDTGTGQTLRLFYSASGSLGWRIGATDLRDDVRRTGRSGEFLPEDYNLLGWTCDPAVAVGASNTLASGTPTYCLARAAVTGYIGQLLVHVSTAGAGLTAGQCFLGLYDMAGNQLGASADLSTVLASTGTKGVNLAAPTRLVQAGEKLAVVILVNGTTTPKFAALANPLALNANLTASATASNGPARSATVGSGQTALPGTLAYASGGNNAWLPWVGLVPALTI